MNKESKGCPYFIKISDKNIHCSKCVISKKEPITPSRIDIRLYCSQNLFSMCPMYKKKHKKQNNDFGL